MDFQSAFDTTLKDYGIKATELAIAAGTTDRQISNFRNKNADIYAVKGLQNILEAMDVIAPGSKFYFWCQVADVPLAADMRAQIMVANKKQLTKLLRMVTDRWETLDSGSSEITESSSRLMAV